MCLGAIFWASPEKIFYGCTRVDAAAIEFDDEFIYKEFEIPACERKIPALPLLREEALKAFEEWRDMDGKVVY